jgi:hypothetical protein
MKMKLKIKIKTKHFYYETESVAVHSENTIASKKVVANKRPSRILIPEYSY